MLLQNNYDTPFWCVYELIERTEKDASNCGKGQKKKTFLSDGSRSSLHFPYAALDFTCEISYSKGLEAIKS